MPGACRLPGRRGTGQQRCRGSGAGGDDGPTISVGESRVEDADGDGALWDVDCDDLDPEVHPGAAEVCNGIDDDCDGLVDDDDDLDPSGSVAAYVDADGDGFGDGATEAWFCVVPDTLVDGAEDCDDGAADIHPDAVEVCNGLDDDCDGLADDDDAFDPTTGTVVYVDADGDGYGDANTEAVRCEARPGTTTIADDCDDAAFEVHPGALEVCNEVDDDCDGLTDDEDDSLDASSEPTVYVDADGDGWGEAGTDAWYCVPPPGTVLSHEDCDDTDADVHPGAKESCNEIDDDCDGLIDDDDNPRLDCWNTSDEICVNGKDDDEDGLTDCEDADCMPDPICGEEEDCDDRYDNEGDGLADCLDPDCWGLGSCRIYIRSRVAEGDLVLGRASSTTSRGESAVKGGSSSFAAASVAGTAFVYLPTAPIIHTDSGTILGESSPATCSWGFAKRTQHRLWTGSIVGTAVARWTTMTDTSVAGGWVDSGCPLTAERLIWAYQAARPNPHLEVGLEIPGVSFVVGNAGKGSSYRNYGPRYAGSVVFGDGRSWSVVGSGSAPYSLFGRSGHASVSALTGGTMRFEAYSSMVRMYGLATWP